MPEINREQALEKLTGALRHQFPADEIEEIYNEMFPDTRASEAEIRDDASVLRQRIVEYLNSGLDLALITELWQLIFVRDRDVWYNEEDDLLCYNEGLEVLPWE